MNGQTHTNGNGRIVPWIAGTILVPLALAFGSLTISNTANVSKMEGRREADEKRLERLESKVDQILEHMRRR